MPRGVGVKRVVREEPFKRLDERVRDVLWSHVQEAMEQVLRNAFSALVASGVDDVRRRVGLALHRVVEVAPQQLKCGVIVEPARGKSQSVHGIRLREAAKVCREHGDASGGSLCGHQPKSLGPDRGNEQDLGPPIEHVDVGRPGLNHNVREPLQDVLDHRVRPGRGNAQEVDVWQPRRDGR